MIFSRESKRAAAPWGIGRSSHCVHRDNRLHGASATPARYGCRSNHRPGSVGRDPLVEPGVASVRASRSLLPRAWPHRAKVVVVVSFDVDNQAPTLAHGTNTPGTLTETQYGATKRVPRIARTLDHYHVPVTFYLPAPSAMLAPQMIPLVTESGKNEGALRGYIHEPVEVLENDPQQERLFSQPVECSAKRTGKRPVGSCTVGWARNIYTIAIAIELLYDSSIANPTRPLMVICPSAPASPLRGLGGTRCSSPPVLLSFPLRSIDEHQNAVNYRVHICFPARRFGRGGAGST
jgi:peptidoglycan/xylan/chitin deacetylase (PgdA/CDA1 family)